MQLVLIQDTVKEEDSQMMEIIDSKAEVTSNKSHSTLKHDKLQVVSTSNQQTGNGHRPADETYKYHY